MFIEPFNQETAAGWIEVICGSMFSGKTEELIRRLKRAEIAHQKVKIFKPVIDTRYHETAVVSHNAGHIAAIPVKKATDILALVEDAKVVGIDEGQFFETDLIEVTEKLANKGIRVIITGLDMDFQAKPFGVIPALLAKAEFITKLHAICVQCGNIANYSYRIAANNETVLLGETDKYESRCRRCYYEGQQ